MPPPPNPAPRSPNPASLQETLRFTYLSELLGRRLLTVGTGRRLGRIVDLTASPEKVYPRITGLLVKPHFRGEPLYIPWSRIHWPGTGGKITVDDPPAGAEGPARPAESDILLKKSFLDRQLISTSGYKVVRVNDLHLLLEKTGSENPNLWLVHIDIGIKGLLRRLGWVTASNAVVRWILDRDMKDVLVPWKFIQAATATNAYGSLQLRTDSSKLSEMHPADLADILEDLGSDERNSIIESLDPATAAATISEMPLSLRVRVAESIGLPPLTLIVREMETDNVVDLLSNLSPDVRSALLGTLDQGMVAQIRELSQLSPSSVGSIMNTDFLSAMPATTVREALDLVRANAENTELVYYVYVLDNDSRLLGVVSLRYLLAVEEDALLVDLMSEHPVSVSTDTSIKRAARIFFKYNFDAIPVTDDDGRMRGIVTMHDTLESVFPEVREESKG